MEARCKLAPLVAASVNSAATFHSRAVAKARQRRSWSSIDRASCRSVEYRA